MKIQMYNTHYPLPVTNGIISAFNTWVYIRIYFIHFLSPSAILSVNLNLYYSKIKKKIMLSSQASYFRQGQSSMPHLQSHSTYLHQKYWLKQIFTRAWFQWTKIREENMLGKTETLRMATDTGQKYGEEVRCLHCTGLSMRPAVTTDTGQKRREEGCHCSTGLCFFRMCGAVPTALDAIHFHVVCLQDRQRLTHSLMSRIQSNSMYSWFSN